MSSVPRERVIIYVTFYNSVNANPQFYTYLPLTKLI